MKLLHKLGAGQMFHVARAAELSANGKWILRGWPMVVERRYRQRPWLHICRHYGEVGDPKSPVYSLAPDVPTIFQGEPLPSRVEVQNFLVSCRMDPETYPEGEEKIPRQWCRILNWIGYDIRGPKHPTDLELLGPTLRTYYGVLRAVGRERLLRVEMEAVYDANIRAIRSMMSYRRFMRKNFPRYRALGLMDRAFGPKPAPLGLEFVGEHLEQIGGESDGQEVP